MTGLLEKTPPPPQSERPGFTKQSLVQYCSGSTIVVVDDVDDVARVIRVLRLRLRASAGACEGGPRSHLPTPKSQLAILELRAPIFAGVLRCALASPCPNLGSTAVCNSPAVFASSSWAMLGFSIHGFGSAHGRIEPTGSSRFDPICVFPFAVYARRGHWKYLVVFCLYFIRRSCTVLQCKCSDCC